MLNAAASSSLASISRSVWAMVRAAWAITAASRASVLALPGHRLAMRLMDRPGRVAHGECPCPGRGRVPGRLVVAHLVNHHQEPAVTGQRLVQVAEPGLVVGQGLVKDLLALAGHSSGPVLALTDVDTDEDADVIDLHSGCSLAWQDEPASRRPAPHPHLRKTLPVAGPSPDQRSPARRTTTGDSHPPPGSFGETGARHHADHRWPSHRYPITGDHQQGNGRARSCDGC